MNTLNFTPRSGAIATYSTDWHEIRLGDGYELSSPKNPFEPVEWQVEQIVKPATFNYLKSFFDINLERPFQWNYGDTFSWYDNITPAVWQEFVCNGFTYKLLSNNNYHISFTLIENV